MIKIITNTKEEQDQMKEILMKSDEPCCWTPAEECHIADCRSCIDKNIKWEIKE